MKPSMGKGRIIGRQDPNFETALLGTSFNAQDPGRRPDLIVQANDVDDVIAAVKRARDEGLKICICSGGHSWAQNHIRDGGLMLDLSRLSGIAGKECRISARALRRVRERPRRLISTHGRIRFFTNPRYGEA